MAAAASAAAPLAPQGAEGGLGASPGEVEVVAHVVELRQLQLDHRVSVRFQLDGELATSGLDTTRLQRCCKPFSGRTRRWSFAQVVLGDSPPAGLLLPRSCSVSQMPKGLDFVVQSIVLCAAKDR